MSGPYDLPRLESALRHGGASRRIEFREEVPSTQDVAFALAGEGAPDGTVVLADRQTSGRGTRGKAWESPAGAGIWFSMILRPPSVPPPSPTMLVAATAVAVAEAVEGTGGPVPGIRWPNDLMVEDRKLAGILLETRDFDPKAPLFILGVGVNTSQGAEEFPPEIRDEATSIALETGRVPDRTVLLEALLSSVHRWRTALDEGGGAIVEESFRARVAYLGRRVRLLDGEEAVEGVLESASPVTGVFLKLRGGKWRAIRAEHARELRPAADPPPEPDPPVAAPAAEAPAAGESSPEAPPPEPA